MALMLFSRRILSEHAVSSVHSQVGAGYVGGRVTGEEQDRAGDLVIHAEAMHGHDLKHRVMTGHVDATVEDAGPHVAGGDGV